ncbi:MAG TPA: alpha-galactosidase, partial [Lachnospiraceae bacterium]|nr:alpha-galactosidase [Lachnospiraceae bacterium]
LPAHRQGEFFHRYVLGLYRILGILTSEFPKILFESCASGGNRFDLGMLCYMPQVWASDNTDAISRMSIQNGYSYGYPLSVIGAHVSGCPNHQTLRSTPLFTRFHAACFGLLGYECNLLEMSKEEREAVRQQVALYKKWRQVFQFGDFYRLKDGSVIDSRNPAGSYHWLCVSKDKKRAICMILQTKTISNTGYEKVRTRGLQEDLLYHFANVPGKIDIREFGDLINTISPIHIKKDSVMHELVSKFYRLQEEQEEYLVYGANLNRGGIKLKQAFSGTGFNENTRHYTDYASRMYFMESEESIEMKKAGK